MTLSLVDIGINLSNKSFRNDLDAVMQRAIDAGVHRMVLTGTNVDGSRAVSEMARTRPGVLYSTCGVHPHDASGFNDDTIPTMRDLCSLAHVVAVGECGLDYNRDFSPRPQQRSAFIAQIALAIELGMPLFLHERDASEDMLAILREHQTTLPRAVIHCFTGTGSVLDRYLDLGMYIGITGWICDERRGQDLRLLVARIPEDRLMLETDAPYLLPRTIRPRPKSRRNEPAFLTYVLDAVAECTGRTIERVAERTTETAIRFFGL